MVGLLGITLYTMLVNQGSAAQTTRGSGQSNAESFFIGEKAMEKFMATSKRCTRCLEVVPITEFYKSGGHKNGFQSHCKKCCRESIHLRYLENPKKAKEKSRAHNHRRMLAKYGLTPDDYKMMEKAQNYVCAICREVEYRKHWDGRMMRLCVDHNHNTGVARGLLCGNCNHVLGLWKDNLKTFRRAITYLMNGELENVYAETREGR